MRKPEEARCQRAVNVFGVAAHCGACDVRQTRAEPIPAPRDSSGSVERPESSTLDTSCLGVCMIDLKTLATGATIAGVLGLSALGIGAGTASAAPPLPTGPQIPWQQDGHGHGHWHGDDGGWGGDD